MKKCNVSLLYEEYNTVIKPLIASIEAKSERFHAQILNEIRAVHDHIARCYLGKDDQFNQKQFDKARSHNERLVLDCLKMLNMLAKEQMQEIESKTRLEQIDSGKFYIKYCQLADEAEKLTEKAKIKESIDKYEAINLFQKASVSYNKILDLIAKNRTHIKWAKIRFWQEPFWAFTLWMLSIILSALAGACISALIK
ncbi:MAG: hypothetical protein J6K91_05975 [Opitutales bacterium]|nr:hypothetical protein [Opitutales bacterium]